MEISLTSSFVQISAMFSMFSQFSYNISRDFRTRILLFHDFFLSDSEIPWCFWKGPLRLSTSNSSATSGECSTRPDWQKSHPTWSWTHRITGVVMHLWRSSRPAPWNTSREGLWHGMFASVSALRFVKYLNGLSIWLEGTLKSLSPSYSSYFWITPRMRTPS